MSDITQILQSIERGEARAADDLLPLVYDELRKLARQKMANEKPGQTLDATALVHEAYLRLVPGAEPGSENAASSSEFKNRRHFFAAAAEAMRRILIDNARRKRSIKRGGDRERQKLDEAHFAVPETREDLLALNEALEKLAAADPDVVELVKLRYFAGLTVKQAAELLGISVRTANYWWDYARTWLLDELQDSSA